MQKFLQDRLLFRPKSSPFSKIRIFIFFFPEIFFNTLLSRKSKIGFVPLKNLLYSESVENFLQNRLLLRPKNSPFSRIRIFIFFFRFIPTFC